MDRKSLYKFLEDTAKLMEDATPDQRKRIYEKLSTLKTKMATVATEAKTTDSADFLEER